jgi:hypothetical protein
VGAQKLILGSDGSREAYDLAEDPDELNPVTTARWVPGLEARAEAWLAGQKLAPEAKMTGPADVEALRSLGYVE